MAGIGFELEKILRRDTYTSILHAYSYAIIVSSGPWLFSVLAILIVSLISKNSSEPSFFIYQFRTLIVYMISASLIISSLMQYVFARFIADRCYAKEEDTVKPNFHGACVVLTIFSFILGVCLISIFLPGVNRLTQLLTLITLVSLSIIWLATISLSGARAYKQITFSFFIGYFFVCLGAYVSQDKGLNALLICFLIGQLILLTMLVITVGHHYPSKKKISFSFLKRTKAMPWLIFASLFYNLGMWVDKYMFWFHTQTSSPMIGLLNISYIYDTPIFISTLSCVFSISFFFLFIETSYMESYKELFTRICDGATLAKIYTTHNDLVQKTREIVLGIVKIQVILSGICFFSGVHLLKWLHIDIFYIYILNLLVFALGLSIIYWSLMEVLFYLDKYKYCCFLNGLFFATNLIFTEISLRLGIFFYGYGLAASLVVTTLAAFFMTNYAYKRLEYTIFTRSGEAHD